MTTIEILPESSAAKNLKLTYKDVDISHLCVGVSINAERLLDEVCDLKC